jgi:hypothetical protein
MIPNYDFNKIKFATDPPTFKKAVALYESGKVMDFAEDIRGYSARVLGGQIYYVSVSAKNFDIGSCDCYMGQNDYLCKHMAAVAIYAVLGGEKIKAADIEPVGEVKCRGRLGELSKNELAEVKKIISSAMKHIKSYEGPSRIWFAYQNSLSEGCNRLSAIISNLPVSEQTAELLVKTLLRLDKKLCEGGVDDSDGTVGSFIQDCVSVLEEFANLDKNCVKTFKLLRDQSTCFGWEEPLIKIFNKQRGG